MLNTVYGPLFDLFLASKGHYFMLKSGVVPQRVQLGHQVYQILRDKIYKVEFEPGTSLGVGEIADQLGVSRSPVRDALLMLVNEGVVEVLPAGGYRVIEFDRKYIEDVFIVRRTLELTAVGLSVEYLDRERVQQLYETWRQLRGVEKWDLQSLEYFLESDHALHQSIAEMSRNLFLKDALDKVISISAMIRRWYHAGAIPAGQLTLTTEEHLKVLTAMLEGDAEAAVAAQNEHLTRAHSRTLEWLDKM